MAVSRSVPRRRVSLQRNSKNVAYYKDVDRSDDESKTQHRRRRPLGFYSENAANAIVGKDCNEDDRYNPSPKKKLKLMSSANEVRDEQNRTATCTATAAAAPCIVQRKRDGGLVRTIMVLVILCSHLFVHSIAIWSIKKARIPWVPLHESPKYNNAKPGGKPWSKRTTK